VWLMRNPRVRLTAIGLLSLLMPVLCSGAELFTSALQKDAFLKALAKQDERYDPAEQMIRRPFSSPGYHTTLEGGTVHPPRDSLNYAVALLDAGQPERLERAVKILHRVIALQDQDPNSRTYGIWSWFMEEPLEKMSPPDWNWADFCGAQLLQVAIDHMDRLPADVQRQVRDSILHAGRAIKRRNVGPGYTNIAVMGAYVTLVAGELFDDVELADYGKARLRRFYDHTFANGSFSEYNSPTYSIVAIRELSRMLRHVRDDESQQLLRELNRFAWSHVARHFHAPTRQWAGPHSRCYATLLRDSTLAFIQRATGSKLQFLPDADALESLDAHRLGAECPADLLGYFAELSEPRLEIETFARNQPDRQDIIGTTYLHPDFTLGSVNVGDLWNQRRPLLAYWNTDAGVVAMRLRCLHDGYDYSSASIFTIQDAGDILGAVVFATDRGDTHISLDRIKNATIKAKDLRVRLEFEGAVSQMQLPLKRCGRVNIDLQIAHAVFDDQVVKSEVGRGDKTAWRDVVLYQGLEREINFAEIAEAAVVFTLSLSTGQDSVPNSQLSIANNQSTVVATWSRPGRPQMSLTIPTRPLPTGRQKAAASARFGDADPWKASAPNKL
ncbi:MAG: hypothetical protein JSW66_07175, partial [Phycisphaerales bacterium]